MYKFMCGHIFSFLLCTYLGKEMIGYIVKLCLIVWGDPDRLFSILDPCQQCISVLISLHCQQYLLLSDFFILAIPVDVKWYLIEVLICISLMTNDAEYHFLCSFIICISFLEKFPDPFPIFELGCLFIGDLWVFYIPWILDVWYFNRHMIFSLILWAVFSLYIYFLLRVL